jgi:5-methylcytosine-specific restriction endonuclease McrA
MKRTPINKISKKRKVEMGIEAELRAKLLEEHGGVCQQCGKWPDNYGLSLHHLLFKSRGGKTIDENCVLICRCCHERFHNIVGKV